MYLGIKNNNIVAFAKTWQELELNAHIKNISFDSVRESNEEIVSYYNTPNDGIYFEKSNVPKTPTELANEQVRSQRRALYAEQSDPLTNQISVLRDQITMGDFDTPEERLEIENEISRLYQQRKSVRNQIIFDNQLIEKI